MLDSEQYCLGLEGGDTEVSCGQLTLLMNVPDDPTDLPPVAGKLGGTRVVPWMGSFVGLVEINETFSGPLSGLSAKDKLAAVGLTCPLGIPPKLTSIRLAEDVFKKCSLFLG